jgi:hypothetical protein
MESHWNIYESDRALSQQRVIEVKFHSLQNTQHAREEIFILNNPKTVPKIADFIRHGHRMCTKNVPSKS